jgi:hypothetical protein
MRRLLTAIRCWLVFVIRLIVTAERLMPNVFKPRANLLCISGLILFVLVLSTATTLLFAWPRSDYMTGVGHFVHQPVPFSHKHHVGDIGIDCRYCHQSVEKSSSAGIPSTETCMKCHSQLWTRAALLQPVRDSWDTGKPLHWNRVHNLPDYVFFNHSIHVNKGVGCYECHGRVDQMPLMAKAQTLHMKWCLDCHRDPASHLRPRNQITSMTWQPPADAAKRITLGQTLMKQYHVQTIGMTDCTTCHR